MEHASRLTRQAGTPLESGRLRPLCLTPSNGRREQSGSKLPHSRAGALWALLTLLLGVVNLHAVAAETRAFWVWNRDIPLTAPETAALRAGGVTRLYWHVGELVARPGGALVWRSRVLPPTAPAGLEVIPTVRLATELRSPELFTADALAERLAAVAVNGRVQVDYDCPDRLVSLYAERLRAVRAMGKIPWLSVTALAGWVDKPGFADLRAAADELCPMFYDLDPDPFAPLLDPVDAPRRLAAWGKAAAGKPWLAGLPAFARVTFVSPGGENQGHLRAWRWEELLLQPGIRPQWEKARLGNMLMITDAPVRLGDRSVPAGQCLIVRYPDTGIVGQVVGAARAAGAGGVAFFRLPAPGGEQASDGPSLAATLGTLKPAGTATPPRLSLRREPGGTLVLTNPSPDIDLEPWNRPYELQMECGEGGQAWREALPGEFGDVEPGAPVGLARRVTFRFARLPAGGSLRTGLVQLAPGTDPGSLRWRLPQLPAHDSWQPVETSSPLSP